MDREDDTGAESPASEHAETPLLRRPTGRTRWLFYAALLVAAALAVWRCG